MTALACFCAQHSNRSFQGDAPRRFPELSVLSHNDRFPDTWALQCSVCSTRWQVGLIPYGGIYGDFDWERLTADAQTPDQYRAISLFETVKR